MAPQTQTPDFPISPIEPLYSFSIAGCTTFQVPNQNMFDLVFIPSNQNCSVIILVTSNGSLFPHFPCFFVILTDNIKCSRLSMGCSEYPLKPEMDLHTTCNVHLGTAEYSKWQLPCPLMQ